MSNRYFARWMVLLGLANMLVGNVWGADSGYTQDSTDGSAQASAEVVYVVAPRGELRSGPSEEFYPTGYLRRGTSLDVYHHTDDNWLGVRPPTGSFSWVPAADAYLLPGGKVIEVTSPTAVSWIGTSLGSAKQYRWQVKLKPGEQLGVLGEQATQGDDGEEVLWYKIAPPSGEFRWIHASTVSSKPPTPQTPATKKPGQSPPQTSSPSAVVSAAYQDAPAEGVIVLGSGSDYYDSGPQEGDVIYEGEVVSAEPLDGEYIEGEYVQGEYVQGEYVEGEYVQGDNFYRGSIMEGPAFDGDHVGLYQPGPWSDEGGVLTGEMIDGEVIYEDGGYFTGPLATGSRDRFAGWHAVELDDDGMRWTWLERLYTRARQTGPDPLADDPFSLSMARGTVRPASEAARAQMMAAGDLYEPSDPPQQQQQQRRPQRGWRDPSTLRQDRLGGYQASPIPAPALSALGNSSGDRLDVDSPLAARLDRVSGALVSARSALTGETSPSFSDAAQQPAANVNWYGISTPATATNAAPSLGANSLDVSQLQVRLSEMVTQPMQLWNLQAIHDSARHYVEHGGSAIERGQARLLMERIEEFADLAQRSGYLTLNRNGGTGTNPPAAPLSSSVSLAGASLGTMTSGVTSSDFQSTFGAATNFDATGWLVPVIAASPEQPTHALTDETGRILSYVSAVPGLNLDRYVNQAVGLTGLRGYLPQLQAGHIQAQRVVRVQ